MSLTTSISGRAPKRGSLARREEIDGWLLASPWLIGFVIFTAGPMLASFVLAFTQYDALTPPIWTGLANLKKALITDPLVLHSLKITTIYAITSIPLRIAIGLFLAMLLNTKIRGLSLYRTIFYLPAVVSGVAVALLWQWLYNPDFGPLNYLLSLVGINGPAWLLDPHWALASLVIMSLWSVGQGIVIYLAGLQGISTELYEAAEVDGATWWSRTRFITIPMMTPVIFFELIIGMINALQVFTEAYVMTQGGPGDATRFFMLYLYQNGFQFYKMGYASTLAWILFVYILVLSILVVRSSGSWVHYEGGMRGR